MPKRGFITIKEAAPLAELSPRQLRKRIVDGRKSGEISADDAYEEQTERGKVWYVREVAIPDIRRQRAPKVLKSVQTSES